MTLFSWLLLSSSLACLVSSLPVRKRHPEGRSYDKSINNMLGRTRREMSSLLHLLSSMYDTQSIQFRIIVLPPKADLFELFSLV